MKVFAIAASLLLANSMCGLAQPRPTNPITMVVAFPAGGADDAMGRLIAAGMTKILGQAVTVENINGRGGMTGAERVARAKPDGSVILLGSSATHALSQSLYKTPLYDAGADFEPVALLVEQPTLLLTRRNLEIRNLAEFGELARTTSNLRYGSAGAGSATHIACARLGAALRIKSLHVPYQGGGPAMNDLMAEKIDFFCPVITIAISQVKANAVKAVATLGKSRSAALPEIPTAEEQGLSDFTATTWFALFVPKNTSKHMVQALNKSASEALEAPDVKPKLFEIGAQSVPATQRTPEFLAEHLGNEIAKYKKALGAAGIEPQ